MATGASRREVGAPAPAAAFIRAARHPGTSSLAALGALGGGLGHRGRGQVRDCYIVGPAEELPDSDGGLGVDPRDVILAYYKLANTGDWQEWLSLFREDVVIDEQLAGHLEGHDSLRGGIDGMEKGYSRFQNVPKHIVCQGDEAAVHSHISAANAVGEPIEAEVANYFTLRDGKIAYMANVHDTRPFDPFVNQQLA